jgi:hypothetical protein
MAQELLRVCAPGGLVGVLAWTPDSPFGLLRPTFGRYLPQAAAGPQYEAWADPDRVRTFFAGQPVDIELALNTVDVRWPTLEAAVHEVTTLVPGCVAARTAIEPTGDWSRAQADVAELFAAAGHSDGDAFVVPVPYLIAHLR